MYNGGSPFEGYIKHNSGDRAFGTSKKWTSKELGALRLLPLSGISQLILARTSYDMDILQHVEAVKQVNRQPAKKATGAFMVLFDIFMLSLSISISIFLKDFLSIFFRIALSISIFSRIALSISIFSKMTISISISISI